MVCVDHGDVARRDKGGARGVDQQGQRGDGCGSEQRMRCGARQRGGGRVRAGEMEERRERLC